VAGIIQISYWDDKLGRRRLKTGYVGEDRIKPDVLYKLNTKFEFTKA
jgi:hypothetical protein